MYDIIDVPPSKSQLIMSWSICSPGNSTEEALREPKGKYHRSTSGVEYFVVVPSVLPQLEKGGLREKIVSSTRFFGSRLKGTK